MMHRCLFFATLGGLLNGAAHADFLVAVDGDWEGTAVEMSFLVETPGEFVHTVDVIEILGVEIVMTVDKNVYPIVPESFRFRAGEFEAGVDVRALPGPLSFHVSQTERDGRKFFESWTRRSAYMSDTPLGSGDWVAWRMYSARSDAHYSEPWPLSLDIEDLAGTWPPCTPYYEFCDWEFHQSGGTEFLVEVTAIAITPVPACAGDLDGSGEVGFTDLTEMLGAWGPCLDCVADLDADGLVTFTDLTELLSRWGVCAT